MKFAKKVKKAIAKRTEEDMKQREFETAGKIAEEMAECYAEIAETDISEESGDAVREMIYGMFLDGRFDEALGLLMVIFEMAERTDDAAMIRELDPEFIDEYSRVMIKSFVRLTGMDPDPTMELGIESLQMVGDMAS